MENEESFLSICSDGTITANFESMVQKYDYTLEYDSPNGSGCLYYQVFNERGEEVDYGDLDEYYYLAYPILKAGQTLVLSERERPSGNVEFLGWYEGSQLLSASVDYTIDPTTNPNRNRTITGKYGTKAPKPEEKHYFYIQCSAYGAGASIDAYIDGSFVGGTSPAGYTAKRIEYTGRPQSIEIRICDEPSDNGRFAGWRVGSQWIPYRGGSTDLSLQDPEDGIHITAEWEQGNEQW